MLSPDTRTRLIDQLNRSYLAMPMWARTALKHALGAPTNNPATGQPFESFREVLEQSHDDTLEQIRQDFEDNGDLLPETDAASRC